MKAIVIGATGLVGKQIVRLLIESRDVDSVLVFSRRETGLKDPKLTEKLVSFEEIENWKDEIQGDVLFSAMGTTLKAAKSKEAQYRIDHDYQLSVAKHAAQNQVKSLVLISTVNADPKSYFFYLRMKGELEEKILKLPFDAINILRPGPLRGEREKPRIEEFLSVSFLGFLSHLVKINTEPVDSKKVAQVAVEAGLRKASGNKVIGNKEILGSR